MAERRRLIESSFPLEGVSANSRNDPYQGPPHPQSLHRWWARRPLPACRAFIFASLVDDPESDEEREEILKEITDLSSWDAIRRPGAIVRARSQGGTGLTGAQLLDKAKQRIRAANGGNEPRFLDPFAGGGSLPLEAARLGCQTFASDINPVAVLILKGTVEYAQRYGQPTSHPVPAYITDISESAAEMQQAFGGKRGAAEAAYTSNPLTADIAYWGAWIVGRARAELGELYPAEPDGSTAVAFLWSRTVPCPNCGADMPLVRQYWLARKEKKSVALKATVDPSGKKIVFTVVEGNAITGDPAEATTSRGDTLCLICRQVVKAAYVHECGRNGLMSSRMTAVVSEPKGRGGKRYRAATVDDLKPVSSAASRLSHLVEKGQEELPVIPDEPLAYHPQYMLVREYGFDKWGSLFTPRQLLLLTSLARLIGEAHQAMLGAGLDIEYAAAVATYLAFSLGRESADHGMLTRWNPVGEKAQGALALQALPMVWDYAELNPFGGSVGSAATAFSIPLSVVELLSSPGMRPAHVAQRDARRASPETFEIVVTDPPYYDSINYADLSDFFYVWLKRAIGHLHPDLLGLPLTPKRAQIVMNVYADGGGQVADRRADARQFYVDGMAESFRAIAARLDQGGIVGVVFAHTEPDAWATLIEGLIGAGLCPTASWPIDTEIGTKLSASTQARLKTSVWMACRLRNTESGEAFLGDVLNEMQTSIRDRLLGFWRAGIRGADFFISAIGPGLAIYGRHSQVLRPDGTPVTVRDFLDLVRKEATHVALEQVLHGADLGLIDPFTRQYVTWVWGYSRAPLDSGEAIALCLATGADYNQVVRPGSIAVEGREKSKKVVRLKTIRERGRDEERLGVDSAARAAPLIDQLQRAAFLWSLNRLDKLGELRTEIGETRWAAVRTLGQAVAECLPDGDEDRRLIFGLLGSNVRPAEADNGNQGRLPGLE